MSGEFATPETATSTWHTGVLGDGEISLVIVPGWVSNVDLWDDTSYPWAPLVAALVEQTRLVMWDKRALGCRTQ